MREPPSEQSERDRLIRQAELIISNVLRGGVLLSAGIILLGVIIFYARSAAGGHTLADKPFPATLAAVGNGLTVGDPLAIIALGLLILLATPVARVAVSIVAFALEGDRRYVVITSIVLLILLASFALGKAGA
jgi:uncharacterized membrane protein